MNYVLGDSARGLVQVRIVLMYHHSPFDLVVYIWGRGKMGNKENTQGP